MILAAVLMSSNAMASTRTTNNVAAGCIEKEQIEDLVHLSGDATALRKQIVSYVITGQCTVFNAGEVVNIEDVSFLGLTRVRKNGDNIKYWMVSEFLSK